MEDKRRTLDKISTQRLLLEAGIKPGMSVLDVGCGRGDVSLLLSQIVGESGQVLGIDKDENALLNAKEQMISQGLTNVDFLHMDLGDLELKSLSFDAVVGRRVLMYQEDVIKVVRQLLQYLKKYGIMFFREVDMTVFPSSDAALPLHLEVYDWIRKTLEFEGADISMGKKLASIFSQEGLVNGDLRSESITIDLPFSNTSTLGSIIKVLAPRIANAKLITEKEMEVDTIEERLYKERSAKNATFIGETTFTCWAYKS